MQQNYAKDNFIIDTFELRRAALFESLNYSMIDRQNRHVKLITLKTFNITYSSLRGYCSPLKSRALRKIHLLWKIIHESYRKYV